MTYTLLCRQILDGSLNSSGEAYNINANISVVFNAVSESIISGADTIYNQMVTVDMGCAGFLFGDNYAKNSAVSFNKVDDGLDYIPEEGEIPYGDISLTLKYVGNIVNSDIPTMIQLDVTDVPFGAITVDEEEKIVIADYLIEKFNEIWNGIKLRARIDAGQETSNIENITAEDARRNFPFVSAAAILRGYLPKTAFEEEV